MDRISLRGCIKRIGPGRLLVFIAFLAFTSLGLPDGLLGIAWPSISKGFGKPLSRLAVLQIAMTVGFFFSSTNAARLRSKLGVGRLLILSNIMVVIALSGYSFAGHWSALILSTVILGLGGGAVDAGLNAYAAENFHKEQVTMLHAFYGLGAALGPLVMRQVLQAEVTWRWGYRTILVIVVLLLLIFILTRRLWHTGQNSQDRREPEKTAVMPGRSVPGRTLTILGVALFLIYTGLEVTIGAWSFTLLTEGRMVPTGTAALWMGVYWAAFTGGRFFFGLFGGRWKTRNVITGMLAANLTGALLLLQPWFLPASLPALPLLGLSCAPLFPFFVTLTPHVVGQEQASRLIGFQVASASLGASAMPFLVGVLVESVSLEAIAYVIAGLSIALAILYRLWIGPRG